MKKVALLSVLALAMTGCAGTSIKNFDAMAPVSLQPSEIMPSKAELAGSKPRVVVFEADHGEITLAKSARVGGTIAGELEKHLGATHSELVDRKLATRLQKELALAEMHGKSGYTGPEVADIAIVGVVTQASAGSSFTEAQRWQDKNGKWYESAAKCNYSGEIAGSIRVYQMPEMQAVKSLELKGSASSSQETRNSNCPLSENGAQRLVQAAASRGVNALRVDLQNIFAPRGYVIEHRSGNGQNIIKVSMGSNHGLKPGNSLEILNLTHSTNPLTNKTSVDVFKLGTARVSDQIGSDTSWMIIDSEIADKIRLGQPVQMQFKKSFLEQVGLDMSSLSL